MNNSTQWGQSLWVVSSTFQIVQILVQSHFELVNSVLALKATEPVSEPVTEMAIELINISTAKEMSVKATSFSCKNNNNNKQILK